MTPKEQQLADRILDIAIACSNPVDISNLVSTYTQLLGFMRYEANCCGRNVLDDPSHLIQTPDSLARGAVGDIIPAARTIEAGDEPVTAPAKTRKPRGSKSDPAPEQQSAGEQEQPAVTETPAPTAPVAEEPAPAPQENGKTHDEKLVEAKNAYLAHFKVLADDDAAQRAFRDGTTALTAKHDAGRISEVKADKIDAFLTDLTDLISKHQPV